MKTKLQVSSTIPKKRREKTLTIGEQVNPDNLRYIDNQGMPYEEQAGGLWSSEIKAFMQAHTLKALFYSEDWVFITVDAIAMPASFCPIKVFKSTRADDGKDKLEALPDHPVSKVFDRPNEYQSGQELAYSLVVDFVLGGNGFLYSPQALGKLYNMPFERCSYEFDQDGMPKYLTYTQNYQDDAVPYQKVSKNIPMDEIIHSRRPNPSSSFWGLSPFTPGRKCVLTNRYTQDYILSFYIKGATPQMILNLESNASQKALVRMIRSFEAAYTGRRNQRRTMVLPKGVKATVADSKIVDQQFIDLVKNNRETVLNILRVPKHALGLQESGSLGSREHELALRWFWEQTILPSMAMISASAEEHFRRKQLLAPDEVLKFDTSEVSYTREDLLKSAEISNSLSQTWTINERREKIFGLPYIEGGDFIVGMPQPGFGPQMLSETAELATQNPTVPIAQPNQLVTEQPEIVDQDDPDARIISDLRTTYEREIKDSEAGIETSLKKEAPKMARLTIDLFADQAKAALEAFKKATSSRAPFDKKKFESNWNKLTKKMETEYAKKYTKDMQATVELGVQNALVNSVFKKTDKDALEVSLMKDKNGRRQQLTDRGIFQFESTTEANFNVVNDLISKGIEEGKSNGDIAKDIVTRLKDSAKGRAVTIARTETLTAVSIGQAATMEAAQKMLPEVRKVWITAGDEFVRPSHKKLDGQSRKAQTAFKLGGGRSIDYPRAPNGDADEVINCRCTMILMDPRDISKDELL